MCITKANRLGFDKVEVVDSTSLPRGIWLLWNFSLVVLDIVVKDSQYIHAIVGNGSEPD